MMRVAVLDDWQDIARTSADWRALETRAEVVFFHEQLGDEEQVARRLADFDILMAMRERTPFPASLLRRLPRLKMFAITGKRGSSLDFRAMAEHGVIVCGTDGGENGAGTAELTLGLMLAAARTIPRGDANIRAGGFQANIPAGLELAGSTLGLIGLGRIGGLMARYGTALGMKILAWSPNLTPERAAEAGADYSSKEELLASADVISLHLVLSERTRGIVAKAELARMKDTAILINTSRGPLIDEASLIEALQSGRLVAALDVYQHEPLPAEHPLRHLPNTILTPHLGYGTRNTFVTFYEQSVENVLAYLDGAAIRVLDPNG